MNFDKRQLLLYAVTAGAQTDITSLRKALDGGVTCVQLREKELEFDPFLKKAVCFKKWCERYSVPLVINDRIDVALACGADGIHLGQNDDSVLRARDLLGSKVFIGLSVQTVEEARKAEKENVDYLGVGTLFPTTTKSDAISVPLSRLQEIKSAVSLPIVGIGGIHKNNMSKLRGTGLSGVALVSAIFGVSDVEDETKQLLALANELFS